MNSWKTENFDLRGLFLVLTSAMQAIEGDRTSDAITARLGK